MKRADGLYVYGVVPTGTPGDVFAGVAGIDAGGPIQLVEAGGVAAVASPVPLAEFDEGALEVKLRDGEWLEQKVQAHNRVLAAAVGKTTVLPLRFGAIYHGVDHVRAMLDERREFSSELSRLEGMLEFGVKAVLDEHSFRARLAGSSELDVEPGSGQAYMLRKRQERQVADEVQAFARDCADVSHERLSESAADARANAVQPPDVAGGSMLLNGAYLVHTDSAHAFREALSQLEERFGGDGVSYELTGPWPPYNFAAAEETK